MWQTLFTKINATLAGITLVKDYFHAPKSNITKFPAVFYIPSGFENSFETASENAQVYRFLMLALVGTNGTTTETAMGTVLPKLVDQIIDAFDAGWNYGTVEGHRVRVKIDSAGEWTLGDEKEPIAYAPLSLEIRLLKNV